FRFDIEELEALPVTTEFLRDIEILVLDVVLRRFQLDITAGTEIHVLALRQLQHQFLDEGGDVVIGNNLALPLLHAEELFRHLDLHILLDRDLAGQAPAVVDLALGEVAFLGRQDIATAFQHLALALRAGTTATTGRGQEDALPGQRLQQLATGLGSNALLRVVVDLDVDITGADQARTGGKDDCHQRQDNAGKHEHTEYNFEIHGLCVLRLQLHAGK